MKTIRHPKNKLMMKRQLLFILALVPLVLAAQVGDLPRSTPAAEGISTQAVINMMDSMMALPECDIHHVMVVRHGKVVAELHPAPFRAEDSHTLYSASKTFTSLAVGIAIDENLLRLDDRVMTFFPDKRTNKVSDNMAAMTVRDLLMMAAGIKPDWTMRNYGTDWVKDWLAKPVDEEPGTHFQYDSMCTFMLSAILERVTGQPMFDYLKKRLFAPMHITQADWETSPDGITTGGWGLRVQAETMAKLGLLLLNKGNWEGLQLVSAEYLEDACLPHIYYKDRKETDAPTDGNQGYGYQIWRCKWPGAIRADGAFGQYSVVVPQEELVVVIMGMIPNGHPELACIWNQLMPGVRATPPPAEKKLQKRLEKLCSNATLPLPQGKQKTNKGVQNGDIALDLGHNQHGIKQLSITTDRLFRIIREDGSKDQFELGYREWLYSPMDGDPPYSITAVNSMRGLNHDFVAAAAAAWTNPTMLEVRVHFVNWISGTTYVFDFDKREVTICDNFPTSKPETISFSRISN